MEYLLVGVVIVFIIITISVIKIIYMRVNNKLKIKESKETLSFSDIFKKLEELKEIIKNRNPYK